MIENDDIMKKLEKNFVRFRTNCLIVENGSEYVWFFCRGDAEAGKKFWKGATLWSSNSILKKNYISSRNPSPQKIPSKCEALLKISINKFLKGGLLLKDALPA